MFARWFSGVLCLWSLPAAAVVFSGEVESNTAQAILTPPSNSSPLVLNYYVADGTKVKTGDVLLRVDAGQAAAETRTLGVQIEQAKARIAKEIADLQLKATEADLALIDAQAALDMAHIDAAIPKSLISALDYDRYQAELERSQRDVELKQKQLTDARATTGRHTEDGKLELKKLKMQHDYDQAQVNAAEVRADQDGTVVHAFNTLFGNGGRYEEGSSSYPGQKIGEVVGSGSLSVRAWVLEPDRHGLAVGDKVRLAFDAHRGREARGIIAAISGASAAKSEWGASRYFVVDIDIDNHLIPPPLKPGMSVRVETITVDDLDTASPPPPLGERLRASGEVFARSSVVISSPQIEDLWQMTLTQMAADGQAVKKSELVVSFDGDEIMKTLSAKKSELAEKLRLQEKLRMELAERARTQTLTTAEAHAEVIKARRKASQPDNAVPGIEYKKLQIARRKAEQHEALSQQRERIAVAERGIEQGIADADVARLKEDVARLVADVATLSVIAPRDGIFVHATNWNGEKLDVGTQVWRGHSVAEIPDMATLAVRANLPERDITGVNLGDRVRVVLESGSGQTLSAHIDEIGLSVHSKSRVEPVPVVDLYIALDPTAIALKPGQPVHVEIVQKDKKIVSP